MGSRSRRSIVHIVLRSSSVTLDGPCGRASLAFQRRGGMQCAKAPENQGVDNMLLPHHEDMVIDCGEDGGTIASIDFASFGMPFGPCGGFAVNASCHAADTMTKVEALCKGKTSCTIPTDAASYVSQRYSLHLRAARP